jgi:hypothetical protein
VRADGQEPDRRRERGASGPGFAKPISIKSAKRRFGGDAPKVIELTSGDLLSRPEIGTEGDASRPDRGAEVSRRHSSRGSDEGRNGPREGIKGGQVGSATHERQAAENPNEVGLLRRAEG